MISNDIINQLSSLKPEIAVTISLILIVLLDLIFSKNKRIIPLAAFLGLLVISFFVYEQFSLKGSIFPINGENQLGYGSISIDSFGAYFKYLVILSTVFIVIFSFISDEIQKVNDRLGEYYVLIFGMILGMFFIISATDLILIYISLELLSFSSYVLAGFTKLRSRNSEAALKYVVFGAVSSGLALFGISLIYGLTGSTNLHVINDYLQLHSENTFALTFSILLIFAGIGYKISAAPFHFWTPDVYEGAPISITAYLSVASKAAGFALLIRFIKTGFVSSSFNGDWILLRNFNWTELIVIVSILTMTLGNFSALWQDNLKRMLAYSSVAHAGYLLLGISVFSDTGVTAVLIYFMAYILMNLGAFFIVMLITDKIGSEDIEDYKGMGYKLPFLGTTLAIFLVSLTGIPPTAGFIGKLYVFLALFEKNMIFLALIALLNSVVSLYYYIRVLKAMYLDKPRNDIRGFRISFFTAVFILLFAVPTVLLGVYFTPLIEFAKAGVDIFSF